MSEIGPLDGTSVVEAGHSVAGLLLGRLLADLGAVVIPVGEQPESAGEFDRWLRAHRGPPTDWTEVAGLLSRADVLLCDGPEGDRLASRGFGPEELLARFPELVTVRISEFGMTGPLSGTPATEATLQAFAGLMAATGTETDPPITSTIGLATRTAALSGLLTVAAALIGRARGTGGDYYDIAEFDSVVSHLGTILPSVALTGTPPPRRGNRHAMTAPWNSYPCLDAYVVLCTMGDAMWRRLAHAIDRPELVGDPRFTDSTARVDNVAELDQLISQWSSTHQADSVIATLRAARIPCARVATPQDVRTSPTTCARGLVSGKTRMPSSPLTSLVPTHHVGAALPRQGGVWDSVPSGSAPLQGIRVLEMGAYTAGPAAGRLLAQLGAEVLKVEPRHGEGSRRLAQQVGSVGYLYFVNNAGKSSCRLDLAKAEDRARFDQLASGTDILLTNLAVDTLSENGVAPEQVLSHHNIVHCAVTGHGLACADRSFDTVIQAETAIMHLVGSAVGSPRRTAVSSVDVLGSHLAAASAALATYARLRTGSGKSADVALFDAAAWATQESWYCDQPYREGPRLLAAEDDMVVIDAPGTQLEARDTVAAVLQAAIESGIPAAPLHDVADVVGHPQVAARHMFIEQHYADAVVLVTGNHLRSLRRGAEPLALAPVDQDHPAWHTDALTTTERKGQR